MLPEHVGPTCRRPADQSPRGLDPAKLGEHLTEFGRPVRTDSAWFHDTLSANADIFLLKGRVRLLDARGAAQQTPFSLMLLALGATTDRRPDMQNGCRGSGWPDMPRLRTRSGSVGRAMCGRFHTPLSITSLKPTTLQPETLTESSYRHGSLPVGAVTIRFCTFRQGQHVFDVNAELAEHVLDLGMAKQDLHGTQIAGKAHDQNRRTQLTTAADSER
jgi:hypothetical protein